MGARELVHPHPSKYKSDGKLAGAFSHSWTSQLPAGVGWAEPHSPSQGLYGIIGVQVRIELNSRNKSYVFPDDRQVAPWLLMEVQCQMSNSRGCCPVVYRVLKWLWMGDSPLSGGAEFLISDSDQPWVLQIAPHGHSPLISAPCAPAWQLQSVPIRRVCVCVCVCTWGVGDAGGEWGRKGNMMGTMVLSGFIFLQSFSFHVWTLTLETPNPILWLFFPGVFMITFLGGQWCFLWASLVAETVKNPPAMQETQVQSLGWEDPLEEVMATHSSILALRIPWTEEPGGLQSMGSQRVGCRWVTNTHCLSSCLNQ